jgi:hypothetical protein
MSQPPTPPHWTETLLLALQEEVRPNETASITLGIEEPRTATIRVQGPPAGGAVITYGRGGFRSAWHYVTADQIEQAVRPDLFCRDQAREAFVKVRT